MYEENENKIQWGTILKRLGMVAAVLLVIFGIFTLVSRCTKNKDEDKPNSPSEVSMDAALDEFEKATLEYLSIDNLPTELNASKTIRLKILINRNLTEGIKDSENNQCDTSESYAEITRLENNYAVKMSLSCGNNKATRIIYVGCFQICEGGICKGEENQTGGVCGGSEKDNSNPADEDKNNNGNSNNGVVTPNIKNPSSQTKPNTNTSTTKPNTNTNTNKPGTSVTNPVVNPPLYEFKRCTTKPTVCNVGTLNTSTGYCEFETSKLDYGVVVRFGSETTYVTSTAAAKPVTNTVEVTLKPSQAKNSGNVTYKFKKMNGNGTNVYYKTTTTYKCDGNVTPVNGICTYKTPTTTPVTYGCADKSYTYNKNNNTCTKWIDVVDHLVPGDAQVCETTWSYSTNLTGWYPTGRVK